ncbi:MAG TPA: flagellar hook-associated protein FlgK [Burkholderiales bacterium]|nr:flagellar hook-associated protein FlgK [Burkholderiales bacterium]
MSGLFGIAISGLNAAQAGLVTTGHNIANASTPGFHRQQVVQSNAVPQLTGAGFMGVGVQVDTIQRVYSDFLDAQASRAQAQSSYYTTYSDQIGQIDNILTDPSAGLAPELQSFFASVHELASNPSSVPSRQALLSAGASLTSRFQALDNRLVEMNRGVNAQLDSTISSVNTYAREIAALNQQITGARADPNQMPNDLLDKRDQLIYELNSLVGASTVQQPDGNVSVTIGNGQSLVVGSRAFQLATVASAEVPDQTDVAYVTGSSTIALGASTMTGGSLGALLAFRAGPLTDARNELGRIAAGLAQTFNDQHRLGQDLTGSMGGDFFTVPAGSATANSNNTGTASLTVSVANASGLTASDYRLAYSGGAYQLTRLTDGNVQSFAALPQTLDGVTIQLTSGTPVNGDSFLIEPTRYAARNMNVAVTNPSEIAAAAPIRTSALGANAGTGTISAGIVNAPVNANLQQPVSIVFTSATTFDVTGTGTGNPVGVAYTAGGSLTYNGWTVNISGAPKAGDTFTIGSNTNGVSDNRNAGRLADLQVANVLSGGTASYQASYAQLTSSVGNTARDMEIASQAQEAIALRTRETQQSVSGVNLDEEAANLLRYQQAYQASGKVIQVATEMFDTILSLGR